VKALLMAPPVGVSSKTDDLHPEGSCLLEEEAFRLARLLSHKADGAEPLESSCESEGMQVR
jgi:hypothetical protein